MHPTGHFHRNSSSDSLRHLLFAGDCREILPHLKRDSVHLVVTSPPYNLKTDYDGYDDNLSFDVYWQFSKDWLCCCYQVLCPAGRIAVNLPLSTRRFGNAFFPKMYGLMREVGFLDLTTLIWVKQFADSQRIICRRKLYGSVASPKSPDFRDAAELIVIMKKPGAPFSLTHPPDLTQKEYADWTMNVWLMETEPNRADHPAPFPLQLPYRLIKLLTVPGNVVLDPFLGSGTTLKACDWLGRRGIGCEISPPYVQTALSRLGKGKAQLIMPPIQPN